MSEECQDIGEALEEMASNLLRAIEVVSDGAMKSDQIIVEAVLDIKKDLRALSEQVAEDRQAIRFLMGADRAEEAKAN